MPSQDSHHPFLAWYAGLRQFDAISLEGKDFILSDLGGKRFAVGVHKSLPLLCWHPNDREALEAVRWTSAAIAYGLKGRDWVALSALDVRVKGSASLNPVPARLFVPVAAGRLQPWKDLSPQKISVGAMKIEKGSPIYDGDPLKELPLKLLAR